MSDADSSVPDGFRQIPGFQRYAIDENGTILSVCIADDFKVTKHCIWHIVRRHTWTHI